MPASYHLPATALDQPFKVTLAGRGEQAASATLQLTGPGYTADVANIPLTPDEALTLYVTPNRTGPELTFVTNQAVEIPQLSIHLSDDSSVYEFDSSTSDYFALTERTVAKSSGFELSDVKLPAGQRVAMAVKGDVKRLYFGDDDGADTDYGLTVKNRIVIRDRVQIGERQPDFVNYTLTYEEDLKAPAIQVTKNTQAYFDYDPTFLDPADQTRDELLTSFEQRDFPIAIGYEPLVASTERDGPLKLIPSEAPPIAERVFQGALRKSGEKF